MSRLFIMIQYDTNSTWPARGFLGIISNVPFNSSFEIHLFLMLICSCEIHRRLLLELAFMKTMSNRNVQRMFLMECSRYNRYYGPILTKWLQVLSMFKGKAGAINIGSCYRHVLAERSRKATDIAPQQENIPWGKLWSHISCLGTHCLGSMNIGNNKE